MFIIKCIKADLCSTKSLLEGQQIVKLKTAKFLPFQPPPPSPTPPPLYNPDPYLFLFSLYNMGKHKVHIR